ncbi:MAG: peroxide stress protein YaaA [Eubacteriales bacterium]|nr:peroxide stress protein YaaA [Eubacteriales bacterium]
MKIIISPAKKMNVDTDTFACTALPAFLEKTEILMNWVKTLSFVEAKKLWACNDKIAELNFRRFCGMDLRKALTPALISYEGIQYQYMAPSVFTEKEWDYVQEHLRILSGFYGVLKPFDGVTPYRLEMQAKACVHGAKNLYDFWGDTLYHEVTDQDRIIVNLASKEYSKCIEKFLKPEDTYITCVFGEKKDGKVIQKGTQAKMARGEMVRYMAENCLEKPEEIKKFDRLDYHFCEELSSPDEYVFLR